MMTDQLQLTTHCRRCPLWQNAKQNVWGIGPTNARTMLVGESPGEEEDKHGTPFYEYAQTGREITHLLIRNGMPRHTCFITNIVKCHPPGNEDPKPGEIKRCTLWLREELSTIQPRVVAAVGRIAARYFLGDVNMEVVHGIPVEIPLGEEGIPTIVVPVYHPAAGKHEPTVMAMVQQDFKVLADVVHSKLKPQPRVDPWAGKERYELVTHLHEEQFIGMPHHIAVDTETTGPYKDRFWCLSFALTPGRAYVIPKHATQALAVLAKHLANPATTTIFHSVLFDLPVLAQVDIHPTIFTDTMSMAYLLQTESQGLKALAARHLCMIMQDYDEVIGQASWAKALAYLKRVAEATWPDPEPILEWKMKDGERAPHVRQPQNVSRRVHAILRDVEAGKADPRPRWDKAVKDGGAEAVQAVLGPMPVADLGDVPSAVATWYAARDADATLRLHAVLAPRIESWGLTPTLERDMRAAPMICDMMASGMGIDKQHFVKLNDTFTRRKDDIAGVISNKYAGGAAVNPGSYPQMSDLLFKRLKLKAGVKTGKGGNSTSEKVLARLVDASPVVQMVRDWRGYDKLQSSYINVLPGKAEQSADGRVHTTLRMTRVITGRLASSSPNLMAQPVRTAEGREIRNGFVADEGYTYLSNDYSQVELRVTAHDSQDPEMLRIFHNDLDIHTQTAARMFGIKEQDVDEMKHRYPSKRVGFGILNGLSDRGLQREMISGGAKEEDWPVGACADLIRAWFDVYKGVAAYMKNTCIYARRYGYVRDMWGRMRLIPNIRSTDRWVRAEAERQAGNAPIQMGAQGVIKEAMGQLVPVYRGWCREEGWKAYRPLIQVHDDLVIEVRDDMLSVVVPIQVAVMESAVQISVPLPVDPKVGKRWGSLHKWIG